MRLCYYSQPAAVEELLQDHADIGWRLRPGGWTPLHKAATRGLVDVAKVLARHGADIDAQADNGWTAMYLVVVFQYIFVFQYVVLLILRYVREWSFPRTG